MTVIFQSHHQLDFCDRILRSFEEDDGESLLVATSSPEVSLASLKLLQLFSPLVREIVKTLPSAASPLPLTLILPDTDASTWKCLMGLLTNGNVDVHLPSDNADADVECRKEKISSLARCLQINLESRQVSEKARFKLRVKRPEELLEEGSTSHIASNQENNIVSNDYDSDQEDVPVPPISDLSDLNYCASSTSPSSAFNRAPNESVDKYHGVERLVESQEDASYSLIDSIDCKTKIPERENIPSSPSGFNDHSNRTLNKEGDINYSPKDVKLTYAAWKARRAELKLQQQNAEVSAIEAEVDNNVNNPNSIENNNSWPSPHLKGQLKSKTLKKCPICSKECRNKASLFFHFKATHRKNEALFECVECPERFVKKVALFTHLSKRHTLRMKRGRYIINSESAMFSYETESLR